MRRYDGLERFKTILSDVGESVVLDISASQLLRDAIVEFDPDIHAKSSPVQVFPEFKSELENRRLRVLRDRMLEKGIRALFGGTVADTTPVSSVSR